MKILLSYSKTHFDPAKKAQDQKYWGSSASILARSLYEILSKLGQVTYIDPQEYTQIKGQKFDLFVGNYINFNQILDSCHIKKSLYFAVNMHPKERNQILGSFVQDNHLSWDSLSGWDMVDDKSISETINRADKILLAGNVATYNSYLKWGVAPDKIKPINYGLDQARSVKPTVRHDQVKRFVYVVSEIGLRKGFDIVADIVTHPSIKKQSFHLDIIGKVTNNHYAERLAALKKQLGGKVTDHGWVESQSQRYRDLVGKSDYVLFPSLEEGQAGSVLDAISHGVVPLISQNAGLDYSPLGYLEVALNSTHNQGLFKKALAIDSKELTDLKNKTIEYYQEYHQGYKSALTEAIASFIKTGQVYPKISLVLPIFNKQTTIKGLITYLDIAARAYKNVELHIIFDGCKDNTESIVRSFYQNKTDYPVTFAVTPDIFEVKTNNIGLKKSKGKYAVIIQDDNFVYDREFLFEAAIFLDKNDTAAILGGLAGVNYYPLGTKLKGPGQTVSTEREAYWRQDGATNPEYKNRIFQVDACMRGPLIFRKSFLEKYGYLDEVYVPLYQDDMDICFRAAYKGFKVFCILMDVENKALTQAHYSKKMNDFWYKAINRNTKTFYKRWKPSTVKNYSWINRTPIWVSINSSRIARFNRRIQDKKIAFHILTKVVRRRAANIPLKIQEIKQGLRRKG
jgi:glycosyltransferase involved in cell wall biosynthesis